MDKVVAIRGAITLSCNDKREIAEKSNLLIRHIIAENGLLLPDKEVVSCVISSTDDINACYPATTITERGIIKGVPLFSVAEPSIAGALPLCVRMLVTVACPKSFIASHVYLGEAAGLKTNTDI